VSVVVAVSSGAADKKEYVKYVLFCDGDDVDDGVDNDGVDDDNEGANNKSAISKMTRALLWEGDRVSRSARSIKGSSSARTWCIENLS
jgi:hypothetical protein